MYIYIKDLSSVEDGAGMIAVSRTGEGLVSHELCYVDGR